MTTRARRMRGDGGVVAFELLVGTMIVLVLFLPLVLFAGRVAQGERVVRAAAQEAARAATLRSSATAATDAAQQVAASNVAAAGVTCSRSLTTTADTSRLQPGGQVTVTVVCDAAMADLAILGVPGTRRFQATSTQVVDTYRSDP